MKSGFLSLIATIWRFEICVLLCSSESIRDGYLYGFVYSCVGNANDLAIFPPCICEFVNLVVLLIYKSSWFFLFFFISRFPWSLIEHLFILTANKLNPFYIRAMSSIKHHQSYKVLVVWTFEFPVWNSFGWPQFYLSSTMYSDNQCSAVVSFHS